MSKDMRDPWRAKVGFEAIILDVTARDCWSRSSMVFSLCNGSDIWPLAVSNPFDVLE